MACLSCGHEHTEVYEVYYDNGETSDFLGLFSGNIPDIKLMLEAQYTAGKIDIQPASVFAVPSMQNLVQAKSMADARSQQTEAELKQRIKQILLEWQNAH